ncbi:RrF2 family transcriptional regulator [Thermovenabulum sp.]|uniref:RrF2 family transcriptional regulator n=1 Tax=Thermovenabulum sp. TaxID=3100335 RepID=UPI003C7A7101
MRLSTRSRYGLRAMVKLALYYNQGAVPLSKIAEEEKISENYLEQIITLLKNANLVKSIRGSQGGYILSRNPEEITVADILSVLEGSITLVDCLNEGISYCDNKDRCVTRNVWKKINDNILNTAQSITLKDLCENYKRGNE